MYTAVLYISALAMVLFPQVTSVDIEPCNCLDVSLADRTTCGTPGLNFDQCKAMGCCYDPRYSDKPSCYVNLVKTVTTSHQTVSGNKGKNLVMVTESKDQDLEELCKKCNKKKGGGLLGLVGSLLGGHHTSAECKVCDNRKGHKRGEEKKNSTD